MNATMNDRCTCPNCPGEGCPCGCTAPVSSATISYAGLHCLCGGTCGCDAADQGCLCRR